MNLAGATGQDSETIPVIQELSPIEVQDPIAVSLLTGGADRPYIFGLVSGLVSAGITLDLIGSNDLDFPEYTQCPKVRFLNLRGDQNPEASVLRKIHRVLSYYVRLIRYCATARPKIFHIVWNNKFELFDRTLLMLYYKLLGKRIVFTAHNVNAAKRDRKDNWLNRASLFVQYQLCDCIFVHTERMKEELVEDFSVNAGRVTVIPFGINNCVPNTGLTGKEARQRLGIGEKTKTILFFGNITPYKGLEYLVRAFHREQFKADDYQLVIAGRVDHCESYWSGILEEIRQDVQIGRVLVKNSFIPDTDVESYFKAADVLVLPYKHIYQSGVLFLSHSFGLPVLAADVGSLKDDIVEGRTGFVFRSEDENELAKVIERYFASELYADLEIRRAEIQGFTEQRHSWNDVGEITLRRYIGLLKGATEPNRCPVSP